MNIRHIHTTIAIIISVLALLIPVESAYATALDDE